MSRQLDPTHIKNLLDVIYDSKGGKAEIMTDHLSEEEKADLMMRLALWKHRIDAEKKHPHEGRKNNA